MKKGDFIRFPYDWADFEDLQSLLPESIKLIPDESDYKNVVLLKEGVKYTCRCLPSGDLRVDYIESGK